MGDVPPAELEAAYYSHNTSLAGPDDSENRSPDTPDRFMLLRDYPTGELPAPVPGGAKKVRDRPAKTHPWQALVGLGNPAAGRTGEQLAQDPELCPGLVGFGGAKAGVDGEGVPPLFTCLVVIPYGGVCIAEALMGAGLLVGVGTLIGQDARIVVAEQGVLGLAHGEQGSA